MSFYEKGAHEMKAAILWELKRMERILQEKHKVAYDPSEGFSEAVRAATHAELETTRHIIKQVEGMDESGRTLNTRDSNPPRETLPTPFFPRDGDERHDRPQP